MAIRRETRRTITVVFCDVARSTELGERLQPETLRRVLTRYSQTVQPVLEAHGGTVQVIGDGVLGVFGIPRLHEDDARRAVRAAVELREALLALNQELEQSWGVRLAVRVGINTGEIAIEEDAPDRPLFGDALNVAARLEQQAAPGEIVLGETTYRLARDAVQAEQLRPRRLRGKSAPVAVYRLVDVRPEPAEAGAGHAGGMVGRQAELQALRWIFDRARRARTCHLVTVLGPAGIGKSRLIAEFWATIADEATILRGRCLAYGPGITYWPISAAVHQAAGISVEDPPATIRDRLGGVLGGLPHAGRVVAQVAQLLGLGGRSGTQEDTFWSIRQFFETLASRRPLVLIVDDLHWAQPALLDLLEDLAGRSRDAPMLLVCSARPELCEDRPTWGGGKPNASTLTLLPLTGDEAAQLAKRLLGSVDRPGLPELTADLLSKAEGNPLFLEELVASALEDERPDAAALPPATGAVQVPRYGGRELTVPPRIHALLAARLERLDPDERTVLERAAIVGAQFTAGAVSGLCPELPAGRVRAILETLVRKELVKPSTPEILAGDGYRFRHALLKDTTYAAISMNARALLHERLADWKQRTLGESATEFDEITGSHLAEAYRYRTELGQAGEATRRLARRAGELLAAAGQRAAQRGDPHATSALLERAAELLPAEHPTRPRILLMLAETLGEAGQFTQAIAILDTLRGAARAAGDRGLAKHAALAGLTIQSFTDLEAVLTGGPAEIDDAIAVFQELGDDAGLATAWRLLAEIRAMRGRAVPAKSATEAAVASARRAGDQGLESRALGVACWVVYLGPRSVDDIIGSVEEVLADAIASGTRRLEARALRVLARAHAMRGEFDTARELLGNANTISTRLGRVLFAPPFDAASFGFVERLAGDDGAAERALRRSMDMFSKLDNHPQSAAVSGALARVLASQGRLREAEQYAAFSRRHAAGSNTDAQVKWRRAQAWILTSRRRFDEAESLARQEIELADATDWTDLKAEARMDLAHVLHRAGALDEMRRAADEARTLYELKGNRIGAEAAREMCGPTRSRPPRSKTSARIRKAVVHDPSP